MTEAEVITNVLQKPRRLKNAILAKQAQIAELRESMLPSAIRYDTDKVQSSPSDPMANYAERLDELGTRLEELEDEYYQAVNDFNSAIDRLGDTGGRNVLYLHYLAEHSISQIAEVFGLSARRVYQLRNEAIKKLSEIL